MAVPELAAAAAATAKGECDGAGSAFGWDSHPVSAAVTQISAERRGSVSSPLFCSVGCHSSSLASLPMARVSLTHGSVQKANFSFADISEKSELALAA